MAGKRPDDRDEPTIQRANLGGSLPARPAPPPLPIDPETLPGGPVAPPPPESAGDVVDRASIDRLLALTDDGWDIDEQVRSLQRAADGDRPSALLREAAAHPPTLSQPSAMELAPTSRADASGSISVEVEIPAAPQGPAPSPAKATRPPPLPPTARSKGPPPLPGSAAGPPPLPGAKASRPPPPVPKEGRTPIAPAARGSDSASGSGRRGEGRAEGVVDLLAARIEALSTTGDRVGLARAHVELAIAAETLLGDEARAVTHARAALAVDRSYAAAHAILRRRLHGRAHLSEMIEHIGEEIASATEEAGKVELLVERARLLSAAGAASDAVRASLEQALALAPHHAAALKLLESELFARTLQSDKDAQGAATEALAAHLLVLADACASEPRLAAWLNVERALLLEHKLGKIDAARGALERAVEIDPGVGPVRDAAVRHVAAHDDAAALAALLEEEATIEGDQARCARLELDAALIAHLRLGDRARATTLLERAAARAPTTPSVDRRVLDELLRLHEAAGDLAAAARVRRARLPFFGDALTRAFELRALAAIAEKLGELDVAISDVQAAMQADREDASLVDLLDRLLAAADRAEPRLQLWVAEAARTEDPTRRAKALIRAAQIAEDALGRPADAIRHLRGAWVTAPGDAEVLDALSRLLTPTPSEGMDRDVRQLVDLYDQAQQHARDGERRIAYLEKMAVLLEEVVGEPRRAARCYEQILELAPTRRAALLGLARCAARVQDHAAHARALLDEAKLAEDGADVLSLKTRAATALAQLDPARALSLVEEVLEQDPAHSAARALETRLHEEAGRWERAAQSITQRIERATVNKEKFALYLSLAQLQKLRLHAPEAALASLRAARALWPQHPVPPAEIANVLEDIGDKSVHRSALEGLATEAPTPEERAAWLIRAAEIDELVLEDDTRAATTYARALAETPDDELVSERLARVLARRAASSKSGSGALGELVALQTRRLERAVDPDVARALSFDLAQLLLIMGRDLDHATSLLESILAGDPTHVPALRTLEALARRQPEKAPLARVLDRQGNAFRDVRARLGALWNLAMLEEWWLPSADATSTYTRILELDPTDPGALEATLRRELPGVRRGDPRARQAVVFALRALFALAADDGTRLATQLRLALVLEQAAEGGPHDPLLHEALERYRASLHLDPLSVTAASGLARVAPRVGDAEASVAAALSLAELAAAPKGRARHLLEAAELLLGAPPDDRLGSLGERKERAATLLERALDADPDSIAAAGRFATVTMDRREPERLVSVFRKALRAATSPDAIVMIGSEIARVARDDLKDLPAAIDAMRRVREVAPQHVPSLLTLSELCIAQRSWPEAVDALEAVVQTSRDPAPRLTALFALASIYERVLGRRADAEQALRLALATDRQNPRALRALLRHLGESAPHEALSRETKLEMAELLDELAALEPDPSQKCDLLVELAALRSDLGDGRAAERALIEAVVHAPNNSKVFARLASCFRAPGGRDHASHARALSAVIARGQVVGTVSANWFATLGQLEVHHLGRLREGIVHLKQAVDIDPDMHETRFELASAFARAEAHDEAVRVLQSMITPDARRLMGTADPAAVLQLLERELVALHRTEDALTVSELRAVVGDLDEGRYAWLRARRLPAHDGSHPPLDRPTLVTHVLPAEGRHVLLEVAAAISGIEAKMLRSDVGELGISSRDRVTSRSGHPTRLIFDRLCKMLGLEDIELLVSQAVPRTRVLSQDEPWVVVPKALTELPEPAQLAALGRALCRIALGVPWLEELPPPHIEALLVAAARQVVPTYAADALDVLSAKLVAQYEPTVTRAIARRHKKLLEELTPHIASQQGAPPPVDTFVSALARAELRGSYVLSGDLLATIDDLRAADPALMRATEVPGRAALGALLEHPYAGDTCRFALTQEATALRRRVGTTWT
jgi:Tfp pilus assembly protein PilF